MAAQLFDEEDDEMLMNEINMTPLIDVMLVLLIVFLIALPAVQHAIKIDLPETSSVKQDIKPTQVNVAVQADGTVLWNGEAVSDDGLRARLAQAARTTPQPELHLAADRKVSYEHVADVMAAAQAGGLTKIGFVTIPKDH
ncbi:ExbD/TolR family protein [Trinickia fusca]|uniref:Biopolymer transporter ExbD n=1 Tax=Trinickia fusca TaxID=2419777 RepID=A0A494XII9_9BURK|nr:biopolymer transporter ExbD [Trinickia fusca]RKP50567.1 biopolymer transporter ExbD [Trinickia fusca]